MWALFKIMVIIGGGGHDAILGKVRIESPANDSNNWINSVSSQRTKTHLYKCECACVLEWFFEAVIIITCLSKTLKCNEAMGTSSLSSSFTPCLAAPSLLSTHFCLWFSVLLPQNNHTLFRILAAITRRADPLFESPHWGIWVSLKMKFHLCPPLHHTNTHTSTSFSRSFPAFYFSFLVSPQCHCSSPPITTCLFHLHFLLVPLFPPSAMQRLFIDINDQWEWVLWEPYLSDAWGTQQTSSRPSAVTPRWPQDILELQGRYTVCSGWRPTNRRRGML